MFYFLMEIKRDFIEEPFLNVVQNFDAKRDYFKFRTSNHSLFIETGRYCNPIIPREHRFCNLCKTNEVEDEIHFLFKCNIYSELRKTFLDRLRALNINLKKELKDIPILFTSGNIRLTIDVANNIHRCFTKRKREMKMEV